MHVVIYCLSLNCGFPRIMAEHLLLEPSADAHRLQSRGRSSFSGTSVERVADLVRRYLPVCILVRFKLVSKEWKAKTFCNLQRNGGRIIKRLALPSPNWRQTVLSGARIWYGTHQWTKEQQTLPDLGFLIEIVIHLLIIILWLSRVGFLSSAKAPITS